MMRLRYLAVAIAGAIALFLASGAHAAPSGQVLRRGSAADVGVDAGKIAELQRVLESGVAESAYPGGVFLAAKDGVVFAEIPFGRLRYEGTSAATTTETIYDLASVSKAVGTTAAAMALYDDGRLQLDRKVADLLPGFAQNGKAEITIRQLLTHSSGLPAWEALWKKRATPKGVLRQLYSTALSYPTDSKSVYSCLGFITLGKVCEKLAGKRLDVFLRERVFVPLGMKRTGYNPPRSWRAGIAPTEVDPERGGVVHGKVHDENAYYLGGVSGNAGLFSTVGDLAVFCQMMANKGEYGGVRVFPASTVEMFTSRQTIVPGSSRSLGWNMASKDSPGGQRFSERSFGHTGFTGTCLWVDPEKRLFGILLTNRVHPTRKAERFFEVRNRVFELLQEAAAPKSEPQDQADPTKVLTAARELMTAQQYCALITIDESGRPQIRTMNPFPPDEQMVVWMATNTRSRKVEQIRKDPRVTLYYADHAKATGYVAVTGRAELVEDMKEVLARKRAYWDQAFPGLKNIVLIKVVPERIDIVNYKHGLNGETATWRSPSIPMPVK